jgi:hypothetical protein
MYGLSNGFRILEVAPDNLQLGLNVRRKIVEVPAIVSPVVTDERSDGMPLPDQTFGQVASNETRRAGHENLLGHP